MAPSQATEHGPGAPPAPHVPHPLARPGAPLRGRTPPLWGPPLPPPLPRTLPLALALALCLALAMVPGTSAQCRVGINYGVNTISQSLSVAASMKSILAAGYKSVKTFGVDTAVLNALKGTSIELVLGVWPFDITTRWAANQGAANDWVKANIVPWAWTVNITTIMVANEMISPENLEVAKKVPAGMWALYNALKNNGLEKRIKVKTPQHAGFLTGSKPPSSAECKPELKGPFSDLLNFLQATGSTLSLTVYPWWELYYNPSLNLDFAFFKGLNGYYDVGGLYYQNQFDATIDAALVAAEKLGYKNINVEVVETGWPTSGPAQATVDKARDFNQRLIGKVCSGQGTPKRPGRNVRTWIFEAFDESWKKSASRNFEGSFGVKTWDGKDKYALNPSSTSYPVPPVKPPPTWCVVRPNANAGNVDGSVSWACSKGGVDCTNIYKVCSAKNRASAVFNAYFQKSKQGPGTCDFTGGAKTSTADPTDSQNKACPFPGRPS